MITMIVEDDADYADIIAFTLKRQSHDVVVFDSVTAAASFAAKRRPGLAVLDVMLPDGDGYGLCKTLRRGDPNLPVLFLSSLDRPSDVVAGLSAGGDDYLAKPFDPAELLARVDALMRRSRVQGSSNTTVALERPRARGLAIEPDEPEAYFDGTPLECTPFEVEILAQLLQYPGQALSHAFLTEQVWGYPNVKDASLLKGHISAIRKKIKDAGVTEDVIRTVHGVGYSYVPAGGGL